MYVQNPHCFVPPPNPEWAKPIWRIPMDATKINEEMLAALKASNHRLHKSFGEHECICSQCAFVRLRDAVLAKVAE